MTRVAISQSNYIPWKGYFDLIHDVDLFVFYDDVQYTVRDWRNRNQIKTPDGKLWLTIPVGSDRDRRISDVAIRDTSWQLRHWRTIEHFYRRARYFASYADTLTEIYLHKNWNNLSELNQALIKIIAHTWLGIETKFVQSSDYPANAKRQERILQLLKAVKATTYVSGPAARAYLDESYLRREGIRLVWKDYSNYPEYPQFFPPFDHAVTILDLLFHTGPRAPYFIWDWRSAVAFQPEWDKR